MKLLPFFFLFVTCFPVLAQQENSNEVEMEPEPYLMPAPPDFEKAVLTPPIYQLNGTFTIMIDHVRDGVADESQDGNFYRLRFRQIDQTIVGQYVGISNDSEFIGQVYQSTRDSELKMVHFEQFDQEYRAYFMGFWKDGKIQGTWYNAGGSSGEFILSQR